MNRPCPVSHCHFDCQVSPTVKNFPPVLPPHALALLSSAALTQSCVFPIRGVITKIDNSSNQQAIIFFVFLIQCLGVQIMFVIVAKMMD